MKKQILYFISALLVIAVVCLGLVYKTDITVWTLLIIVSVFELWAIWNFCGVLANDKT